jgi:hypothetical protein
LVEEERRRKDKDKWRKAGRGQRYRSLPSFNISSSHGFTDSKISEFFHRTKIDPQTFSGKILTASPVL